MQQDKNQIVVSDDLNPRQTRRFVNKIRTLSHKLRLSTWGVMESLLAAAVCIVMISVTVAGFHRIQGLYGNQPAEVSVAPTAKSSTGSDGSAQSSGSAPSKPGQTAKSAANGTASGGAAQPQSNGTTDPVTTVLEATNITPQSLQLAVTKAAMALDRNPNQDQTITIPRGTYDLSSSVERSGTINLSRVHPNGRGRLHITGAGQSATTLIFDRDTVQLFGNGTKHVTIENLHLTTKQILSSQGHVVSATAKEVILRIDPGYPSPNDIAEYLGCSDDAGLVDCYGKWLKQFTDDPVNPQMITAVSNVQISWSCPLNSAGKPECQRVPQSDAGGALAYRLLTNVLDERWAPSRDTPIYKPGDLIGMKSKSAGQAYNFVGSSDIIFSNVTWTQKARGVFRQGTKNVQILNCAVKRGPPINGRTPVLSTSDGGPQIGQPHDLRTTGNIVNGYTAVGTGDDSLAFFNADNSRATNVYATDSFARGILLNNSPNVYLEANNLVRNRLVYKSQ